MKNLVLFIFCLIAVFLQFSVAGVFFSASRIPDLALALVITFVLTLGFEESVKWILLAGILIDAGSSAIFGTTTLGFFVMGWLVSWTAGATDLRSKKTFFAAALGVLVALSEIAKDLLVMAGAKIRAGFLGESSGISLHIFSFDYLLKIIYTIFATYIIYYVFRRLSRKFFYEPIKLAKKY